MCPNILKVVLILSCFYGGCEAECPDGWVTNGTSCYLFDHSALTFKEAQSMCNQENGHIVEIETMEENSFIQDFAKYLKPGTYWIGLSDEQVETTWQWTTSNVVAGYTDWVKGRPANSRSRNCAMAYGSYHFQWYDVDCHGVRSAICERSKYFEAGPDVVG